MTASGKAQMLTARVSAVADPRDPSGPFAQLLRDIQRCKQARTCRSLRCRTYYFEPNPATTREWQALGLYVGRLDRRVAFVCESPGPQCHDRRRVEPSRCWSTTQQDERFKHAREDYGFLNCYITNVVKCGTRAEGKHPDRELSACRGFLVLELDLLRPLVVVGWRKRLPYSSG